MSTLIYKAVLVFLFFSIAQSARAAPGSPCVPGGRFGFHGMVVFGSGPYYIDHIPMLMAPHDFQLVAEVQLKQSGGLSPSAPITADFSAGPFTIEPAGTFSLDDLAAGREPGFIGAIHSGSFENGGPVLPGHGTVSVTIKKVLLARALPGLVRDLRYYFGAAPNVYSVNLIIPSRNRQEIKNDSTGQTLWCVKGPEFTEPCDAQH